MAIDEPVEVERELVVELLFDGAALEDRSKAEDPIARHDVPPASRFRADPRAHLVLRQESTASPVEVQVGALHHAVPVDESRATRSRNRLTSRGLRRT